MFSNETVPVSYKILVTSVTGKVHQFNYVDSIDYTDGSILLRGNEQSNDGTMIRRDWVLERHAVALLEVRVIRK